MGEVVRFNNPYWKCFYLPDRKQRWLYTDEESAIRLKDKDFLTRILLTLSSIRDMRQKKIKLNQ